MKVERVMKPAELLEVVVRLSPSEAKAIRYVLESDRQGFYARIEASNEHGFNVWYLINELPR